MKQGNKGILIGASILFLAVIFVLQRVIFFVNDDWWYMTNLVTEKPLAGLRDIWESQYWHYFNWGGRSVNHAVLQLVLMCGELVADIFNTILCGVIAYIICKLADAKEKAFVLLAGVFLIALNPSFYNNMFWQSGAVNYLYATCWIFCFAFLYLNALNGKMISNRSGIVIWMPILGLMTGWSCENMGPASFLFATCITVYLWKWEKKKPTVWMVEGILASLAGCLFMILAPGNYVRSDLIEQTSLVQMISIRVSSMLVATCDFLLPVFVLAIGLTLVYLFAYQKKLTRTQIAFLAYGIVAHGGMALSPTYPSRAVFGVLAIFTVYMISLLAAMAQEQKARKVITAFGSILYLVAVCQMIALIIIPPFTR
ncbi:MAG: DUF6056 family protein [Acetatifactor sp.]|nr:DUF6056 family protein [Acetatifactor sp.]